MRAASRVDLIHDVCDTKEKFSGFEYAARNRRESKDGSRHRGCRRIIRSAAMRGWAPFLFLLFAAAAAGQVDKITYPNGLLRVGSITGGPGNATRIECALADSWVDCAFFGLPENAFVKNYTVSCTTNVLHLFLLDLPCKINYEVEMKPIVQFVDEAWISTSEMVLRVCAVLLIEVVGCMAFFCVCIFLCFAFFQCLGIERACRVLRAVSNGASSVNEAVENFPGNVITRFRGVRSVIETVEIFPENAIARFREFVLRFVLGPDYVPPLCHTFWYDRPFLSVVYRSDDGDAPRPAPAPQDLKPQGGENAAPKRNEEEVVRPPPHRRRRNRRGSRRRPVEILGP